MDRGFSRGDVLARAGVSVEEWMAAQRAWQDRMGEELALGRLDLARKYQQAFAERQEELERAPRALAAAVEVEAEAKGALPGEIAPPPRVPPMAAPAYAAEPAISPWARRAAASIAVSDEPSTLEGVASPIREALPFQDGSAVIAAPSMPTAPRVSADLESETQQPTASPLRAALPFQPQPSAPPRIVTPPVAPAAKSPSKGATLVGAISPFAAAAPLPFAGASAKPSSAPVPAQPPVTSALPFSPVAKPTVNVDPGGLTLEQHASLCAELAHAPERTQETLSRYRVTAEKKAEMDRFWKARFTAEPPLEKRWYEAYQYYFAFLSSGRAK